MNTDPSLKEIHKEYHGTFKSYMVGFVASLLLTVASFGLVITKLLSGHFLIYAIVGLALVQAVFQLLYFLKLGSEDKPRWETVVFYFMVLVLLVIAIGSLWIMNDLDNRLMSDMTKEMTHD